MPVNAIKQNRLLASLSQEDFWLLQPGFEILPLSVRQRLDIPGRTIEHVHFPQKGLVSVMVRGPLGRSVEAAMVGREGMCGWPIVLGVDRAPFETMVQSEGQAIRLPATALRDGLAKSTTLAPVLLGYAHVLTVQIAGMALASASGRAEVRLARWLLMAQDRLESDSLPFTHGRLSQILSVRRPRITALLQGLAERDLVEVQRALIIIRNRSGLEKIASGVYGPAEQEFRRLFDP